MWQFCKSGSKVSTIFCATLHRTIIWENLWFDATRQVTSFVIAVLSIYLRRVFRHSILPIHRSLAVACLISGAFKIQIEPSPIKKHKVISCDTNPTIESLPVFSQWQLNFDAANAIQLLRYSWISWRRSTVCQHKMITASDNKFSIRQSPVFENVPWLLFFPLAAS